MNFVSQNIAYLVDFHYLCKEADRSGVMSLRQECIGGSSAFSFNHQCHLTPINMPKDSVLNGIGIYDLPLGLCLSEVARTWRRMLYRCYDPHTVKRCHTYQQCSVCNEWRLASNFKKWFDENYIDGYDLDKDLLSNGSKIYSPDTCCFIPHKINMMIIKTNRKRGKYPMGVSFSKRDNKYFTSISIRGRQYNLGRYPTVEHAFKVYKTAKESYIKEVAQEYYDRGEITKRVYDALMRYEVEITD